MNISCLPLLSINVQKATSTVDFEISNPKDKDRNESYVFSLSVVLWVGGSALAWELKRSPESGSRKNMRGVLGLGLLTLNDLGAGRWAVGLLHRLAREWKGAEESGCTGQGQVPLPNGGPQPCSQGAVGSPWYLFPISQSFPALYHVHQPPR